jgi:hypothetical protein
VPSEEASDKKETEQSPDSEDDYEEVPQSETKKVRPMDE